MPLASSAVSSSATPTASQRALAEMIQMDALQKDATELARERRVLATAAREREERLIQQEQHLNASNMHCCRLEEEAAELEIQIMEAERRAAEITRGRISLEAMAGGLHVRATSSSQSQMQLQRDVIDAEEKLRSISDNCVDILQQYTQSNSELEILRGRLKSSRCQLEEAKRNGDAETASLERQVREEGCRLRDAEAKLHLNRAEAAAVCDELQQCRQALITKSTAFGPVEATAKAAKAEDQSIELLELEAAGAAREVMEEAVVASSCSRAKLDLDHACSDLKERRVKLAAMRQTEAAIEAELRILGGCRRTQDLVARNAARDLGEAEARRNVDLMSLGRKQAVYEAEVELERSRLEGELKEVHERVQSVGSELQAAKAEVPIARACTDRLRNAHAASELHEKEMAALLQASEASARQAEALLEATLSAYRNKEEETRVTTAEQDARLAAAECTHDILLEEVEELNRQGAKHRQRAQDEVKRLAALESQLRSSTSKVEVLSEDTRTELKAENDMLEKKVAALQQKRDCSLSRVQQVHSVLEIVASEHCRSEACKNAEIQAIQATMEARNSEHRLRHDSLCREVINLRASAAEMRTTEARLEALNAGLRQQVCLLGEDSAFSLPAA